MATRKLENKEYQVLEIELNDEQIEELKDMNKGDHKHFKINGNGEVIIHKK